MQFHFTLAIIVHFHYFVQIVLKDRDLLESNLSVRTMPRQKAPVPMFIGTGAFFVSVLAPQRKTQ
jgi:hypothetical protein